MTGPWPAVAVGAVALALALLLPLAARPLLKRAGVIDMPNARSSHQRPTIRGMGITTAVALIGALVVALFMPQSGGQGAPGTTLLMVILLSAAAAAAVGWIEDIRGLGIKVRAGLQLAIGAVATGAVALADMAGNQLWWIPAGAVAVAAFVNVANFMDGLNGISGFQGLIIGGFYAYAGYLTGHDWLIYAGVAIGVAFAGFLPWNLGPDNVFLGDVGSYLLGASISVTAMTAFLSGVPAEYVFSPVLIYLADTFVTFLRRLMSGEPVYMAHRQHAYQRLTDAPMSHLRATAVVSIATVLVSALGVIAASGGGVVQVVASLLCLVVVYAYLRSPEFFARLAHSRK